MTIEARFKIARQEFVLDLSLSLPERGVTAIFGPSGCGKTTLLRAIAGLEHSGDGYLRVADEVWQEEDHFLPPHKRPLGYVFQEASLFDHLNVQGNLEYGLKRVKGVGREPLERAIKLLDIAPLMGRRTPQLSGGERQRIAIARALALNPRILLMDEPLAALDRGRKQEILPYLESLHDKLDIPVIYVSHSSDEVARLADYLVLLEEGKLKGAGSIRDMLTRLDMPLAHGNDAEALIEAVVAGHDDEFDLTYVDFPGGRFTVTRKSLKVGQVVRVRVAAKDASLTLHHQSDTSILNIFPATVEAMSPQGSAQVMVRLLAAGVPMLARVTRKSASLLDLKPGKELYLQAKSVALLA